MKGCLSEYLNMMNHFSNPDNALASVLNPYFSNNNSKFDQHLPLLFPSVFKAAQQHDIVYPPLGQVQSFWALIQYKDVVLPV